MCDLDSLRDKYCTSAIRAGYGTFKGYCLPESFTRVQQKIEDFEVYDDDVWVTSFPRCGTTWTQEMVWCIGNNVDLERANRDIDLRFPFIDYCFIFDISNIRNPKEDPGYISNSVEHAKNAKRPRFIKTHLPWDLLPKQIRTFEKRPKIIHVYRNPKDACVSFYHHNRLLESYKGDFPLYAKLFLNAKISWTPFSKTVLSFWQHRNESNILITRFEDMKTNLAAVIQQVTAFLNVKLNDDQIKRLLKHLSFESMRGNANANHQPLVNFIKANHLCVDENELFIRQGESGKNREMTEELNAEFDAWIAREFKGSGIII